MDSQSIGRKWRDLSGRSFWEGLLEPLDIDLRHYILHYGQLAQATYDAFNSEKLSVYAGNCRYSKRDFFSRVGLEHGNPFKYEVTEFLYATSKATASRQFVLNWFSKDEWSMESNWIGYVAVATDEGKAALGRRDIVVAWRGTVQGSEWVQNLDFPSDPAPLIFPDARAEVHTGFYSLYTSNNPASPITQTSVRNQVLEEVGRLVEKYKDEEISISVTGHSLGGALATLTAVDIIGQGLNIRKEQPHRICPVTAFLFASPRVGNSHFGKIFSKYKHLRALRIRNKKDQVPKLPIGLTVVGEELVIDTRKSKYLKDGVSAHNLEVYLHGVAGTQGKKGGFNLEVNRDISLLNKNIDALKDEYLVPVEWRVHENKGMVQQSDGTWKLIDHNEDVIPSLHASKL
ncbi:phospholipase A1-IIgamma-like [Vigna unguiculata]|uniref:phospholipase A1-IIgamma-like n=1 Tax=Vigna unguiculata TaxID=3917 RepID=UPI0010165061|nr:phospholipase A1-IIgamma-like [Vigna unguiculata]